MNLLHRAGAFVRLSVLAALCSFGILASAQSTAITASQQQWGGLWLTQGTISMIPVTPTGQPIAFSANGKFYPPRSGFDGGFQGTIVRGALTAPLTVPDRAAAIASYSLCYDEQIRNTNTGQTVDIGVRCDITGSSVSLDIYVPPVIPPVLLVGYSHGLLSQMPTNCAAGSIYGTDDTNALYKCGSDGRMHLMMSAGSGGGTSPSTLLFADTSTPSTYWTLTLSQVAGIERLSLSPSQSSSGSISALNFADPGTGNPLALSVSGGRITVSPGSSTGAVPNQAFADSTTGATRTLSAYNGRFNLN